MEKVLRFTKEIFDRGYCRQNKLFFGEETCWYKEIRYNTPMFSYRTDTRTVTTYHSYMKKAMDLVEDMEEIEAAFKEIFGEGVIVVYPELK